MFLSLIVLNRCLNRFIQGTLFLKILFLNALFSLMKVHLFVSFVFILFELISGETIILSGSPMNLSL